MILAAMGHLMRHRDQGVLAGLLAERARWPDMGAASHAAVLARCGIDEFAHRYLVLVAELAAQ